ncbi:MAG TPA: HAMP domain-containing sensor histidine kinase [Candidatus Eisenbacteria bacterium]|jgi:signal transduction histidine kinase
MAISRFRRSALLAIALGVALPAAFLAGTGIYLTIRIASAIQTDSSRYNSYIGQQVAEAFEQELMDHLRRAVAGAEKLAREGAPAAEVESALAAGTDEFEGAHFVRLDDLNGVSLLVIDAQPVIYAAGEGPRRDQYFTGVLLRGPAGQVSGAGGWWIRPAEFLRTHLETVFRERMPQNPRLYGGIENTRNLSVELFDNRGERIVNVREPGPYSTARVEHMTGPFENFSVRVTSIANAPAVWTGRFLALELGFIAFMGLAILAATVFGYRYTIRQIELAQLKSGFVSSVTHELKTPVALIRLAVETLEMRRVKSPEETDRFLRTISRETQRLAQLVDNILEFARLEAGQVTFRFGPVELPGLVQDVLETLRPRLDHLEFKVETDVPDTLPPARGDALGLTHCLLNLMDNAIKYSRTRREIRISATARDGTVALSVADRGIGISPADRRRIFEKFVRLENGLVHDVRGAGLGLSLVDQIIRAHGGRVEVVSALGEGSTFTLVLPAAAGAERLPAEPERRTAS